MQMNVRKSTLLHSSSVRFAVAGLLLLAPSAWAQAQWAPSQPVEIVVGFAPGGGSDRSARKLQRLLQEKNFLTNVVVVNKPGGAGTVGWAYLDQHSGNGHYISVATPTLLTNHITGRSKYNYTDFTPIARLFTESAAFAVRADSPIKDWKDLVARLRKDPSAVALGSGTREGAAALAFAMAVKAAGADPKKTKLVVFNSAGEAVTAALGGHIDMAVVTSEGVKGHLGENRMRVLAISAAMRPTAGPFAAVPTLTEQGINVVFGGWRVVLAPGGIGPQQVAYWDSVFARLTATEEWKQELERSDARNEYLSSTETRRFLDAQYKPLKELMSELGLAKQ